MGLVDDQRAPGGELLHVALFYTHISEYVDGVLGVIDSRNGERPTLVAVSAPVIDLLREELGDRAAGIHFINVREAGRNPTRVTPVLLRFADEHPDQHIVIVCEPIWPERTAAEYGTAVQSEALANLAFAGRTATIVCAYHVATVHGAIVHDAAVDDAVRTHPVVVDSDGDRWESLRYADQVQLATEALHPLPKPPTAPETLTFEVADQGELREFVTTHATRAGLRGRRLDDLLYAVAEATSDIVERTSGPDRLRIWRSDERLVCELHSTGQLAPLAGRLPGDGDSRGLLLASEVADLVQIDAHPTGTTVRIHVDIQRQ
ncbi:anti-sigma factor RsbA family regulatory protein [Actinopolymorpha pittospori]